MRFFDACVDNCVFCLTLDAFFHALIIAFSIKMASNITRFMFKEEEKTTDQTEDEEIFSVYNAYLFSSSYMFTLKVYIELGFPFP